MFLFCCWKWAAFLSYLILQCYFWVLSSTLTYLYSVERCIREVRQKKRKKERRVLHIQRDIAWMNISLLWGYEYAICWVVVVVMDTRIHMFPYLYMSAFILFSAAWENWHQRILHLWAGLHSFDFVNHLLPSDVLLCKDLPKLTMSILLEYLFDNYDNWI